MNRSLKIPGTNGIIDLITNKKAPLTRRPLKNLKAHNKVMKIELKKLSLTNFKGIKSLVIDTFDDITNVFGDNATGKTTVFDAFLWLLFGKDSTDRKDFEIKTLDSRNNPIRRQDHEVAATLLVDGEEKTLRRLYKEKWVKNRGKVEPEFSGHTTEFFWNDVPLQANEFKAKIDGLVDESVFKLITNTAYFNSMDWKSRRMVLESIAGVITDAEIAEGDTSFEALLAEIKGKSFAEYKAQLSARKKNLKEKLEEIPARIQEANRAMPDEADFSLVEKALDGKQQELRTIEDGIIDQANAASEKNAAIRRKIDDIHNLQTEIQNIEHNIRTGINQQSQDRQNEIAAKKRQLRTLQDEVQTKAGSITRLKDNIKAMDKERAQLREEWELENKKVMPEFAPFEFDESACTCPTCKQALPADQVANRKDALQKNYDDNKLIEEKKFNTTKADKLITIQNDGKKLAADIAEAEQRLASLGDTEADKRSITNLQQEISALEQEHSALVENEATEITTSIANNTDLATLRKQIAGLEAEKDALEKPDTTLVNELREKKVAITKEIDELKERLGGKQQRQQQLDRIAELERQEKDYSQQIADLEGKEFTVARFERAKMDQLEEKVNALFKEVKFKMFDQQINGGEVPTCVTLINSNGAFVPYPDANNAARINAGLDIIRVLSAHHKVWAPIFIDNAESVTKLISVDAQVVRLVVSGKDKKLRVEAAEMVMA
jgi:exonuclease SbcC